MNNSIENNKFEVFHISTSYQYVSKAKQIGTIPCRHWTNKGVCPYSETCTFSHIGSQPHVVNHNNNNTYETAYPVLSATSKYTNKVVPKKQYSNFKTKPCKYFASGYCNAGDACTFLHVESKVSIDTDDIDTRMNCPCGDKTCSADCGTLDCGCIDMCRKHRHQRY